MGSDLRLRKALRQADRGDLAAAVATVQAVAAETGPSPLRARAERARELLAALG